MITGKIHTPVYPYASSHSQLIYEETLDYEDQTIVSRVFDDGSIIQTITEKPKILCCHSDSTNCSPLPLLDDVKLVCKEKHVN